MHADLEHRRIALPSRGKAAQRRRRLDRGVRRWDFDRRLCAEPTRRIARVTLTVPDYEPEAAIGWVYEFLAKIRRQWLGTRYFCWLELQRRGSVHYHLIWLNPPSLRRVNLVAWIDRAWGHGRTQVRFSDGRRGIEQAVDYAVAHTKKMGKKSFQQRYDDVPSELRTFMSQRLEIPPEEIDKHLDQDVYAYRSETLHLERKRPGQTVLVDAYLEYLGQLRHEVPIGGSCSATLHRRPRARPRTRSP